jgi:hypothetical protein
MRRQRRIFERSCSTCPHSECALRYLYWGPVDHVIRREDFRFQCGTCGEWHEGLPDLGYDAPLPYFALTDDERSSIAGKSDNLCSIAGEHFFVQGVIELPIVGQANRFGIGVWVSLKKENFERYAELFDSEDTAKIGPYFGWLCNRVAGYADTLSLKTRVHLQPPPNRPLIELKPTEHPLEAS